jgi:UDPglucose--hexose-1-phosphate uridylyltransferase
MQNEIRKDYILERYAIISSERAKRPTDFAVKPSEMETGNNCPFCPGNEEKTPKADLVYLQKDSSIIKEKDTSEIRHRDWLVRCFSNLYPALSPNFKQVPPQTSKLNVSIPAYGFHEIVVESPIHDEHPHNARLKQLELAFDACLDVTKRFYSDEKIEYAQIFRNHRREAGASLSHCHTQIIAMPIIPTLVKEEFEQSRKYYEKKNECLYCKIVADEKNSPRLIYEGESFIVVAPWASIHPFEFWIIPKNHESDLLNITNQVKEDFTKTLRLSLGGLARILNDPPYNYGFHTSPKSSKDNRFYHWHLEVYPKLSTWAGFEVSTNVYINITPPKIAANTLRESLKNETNSFLP